MDRAYSMNGGEDERMVGYWWQSQKERDHWEDQDVGELIIIKRKRERV
jgi:hypothetical protein